MRIGIAGGGLIGRLLAWRCAAAGAEVEVFDAGAAGRCAPAAAGMLAPVAELARASRALHARGMESCRLWPRWLAEEDAAGLCVQRGAWLTAHGRDRGELERVADAIAAKVPDPDEHLIGYAGKELAEMEPALAGFERAYLLPAEGQVLVDEVLELLGGAAARAGVSWRDGAAVEEVGPGRLRAAGTDKRYDWACDCRGLGARPAQQLRAVRGECLHVHCPGLGLRRPTHVLHPRQPVYIVPRPADVYVVGATEIESDDPGPVTVRSALELLGAAYAFNPLLAEGRVVDARVGLRPALPDNEPALRVGDGELALSGMHRHGYLAGPACVSEALAAMGLA
ncbi:MAG: FAD-dependent oxidoreductase [Betaproteobacteria bacterium AqS2]|uniref:D-amino-acid oxidase n=1 Tax=Candidatus Amphirhobacter heronislandensis TaxID=1732024 RepID=A0A930XYJ0_9GAMM|nr:FAD-dependent oxidoreductase [Betaproteobacteria bacterium AqS2]